MVTLFKRFERNIAGRDFVVGDIHGCFGLLRELLVEVKFDEQHDRLFSLGDLIDRGAQSEQALHYLQQPWFHAVRGNHEQLAIEGMARVPGMAECHVVNGGIWFWRMPLADRKAHVALYETMPLAIEIDTAHGLVGLVHAEPPVSDWTVFTNGLADLTLPERGMKTALWGRLRLGQQNHEPVANVHRIYVGHSTVETPIMLGNVCYIDTGAYDYRKGRMTLVNLNAETATIGGGPFPKGEPRN